jgi:hypothetical protein
MELFMAPIEPQRTEASTLETGEIAETIDVINWISAGSRHIALLGALLATGGSLFFSEVFGWMPCELCWYQRILMYPLALILTIGIWRNDRDIHLYGLPLALGGTALALYHYLLVMQVLPPPACRGGIPCNFDYISIPGVLSFVKIPFLSLTAFAIISIMLGNHAVAGAADDGRPTSPRGLQHARIAALALLLGVSAILIGLAFWIG